MPTIHSIYHTVTKKITNFIMFNYVYPFNLLKTYLNTKKENILYCKDLTNPQKYKSHLICHYEHTNRPHNINFRITPLKFIILIMVTPSTKIT